MYYHACSLLLFLCSGGKVAPAVGQSFRNRKPLLGRHHKTIAPFSLKSCYYYLYHEEELDMTYTNLYPMGPKV